MENLKEEIWKETNISGYFISNYGNLLGRSGKPVKQHVSKTGYYVYTCYPDGRKGVAKGLKIHRLVAEAFIPNPDDKPFVNHIDGNKLNNNVENLEWCTNQENMIHASKHGLLNILKGEENPNAKLTRNEVKWIKEHFIAGDRQFGSRALGRKFGISHQQILDIIKGKSYKED